MSTDSAAPQRESIARLRHRFPIGMPVIVGQESHTGTGTFSRCDVVGTVLEWAYATTGSWYAANGDPSNPNTGGRLRLLRLLLRKSDGERTEIVIDDRTNIAELKAI